MNRIYRELEFRHISDNYKDEDRWPFVYLHGKAEFEDARDDAPDLCLGNLPMPDIVYGTTAYLKCTVRGLLAICVLDRPIQDIIRGRIALLSDREAMKHAKDIKSWR